MAKRAGVDKWLFFTTVLLIVAGLAMVYSASAVVAQARYQSGFTFVGKQAIWAALGVLAMLLLSHVDYTHYKTPRFIYTALSVTTFLLVLVFFMPGSHNTHRWIRFGDFFTLQPSEIAKPVLVLFLAWFLSTRLDKMSEGKSTLLRAALIPLVFCALIVRQPDLGTALVLAGVTLLMLFLAGMPWKYLLIGIGVMLPPLAWLIIMVPWRLRRVLAFLNPDADPQGAGFHINQSLIAVATGGITSGSETNVSMMDLPGQSRRASAHASARPNGRITSVLKAETHAVNQTICHSAEVMPSGFSHAE